MCKGKSRHREDIPYITGNRKKNTALNMSSFLGSVKCGWNEEIKRRNQEGWRVEIKRWLTDAFSVPFKSTFYHNEFIIIIIIVMQDSPHARWIVPSFPSN